MKFWPSKKVVVPEKLERDGDIGIDQWASYFNFNGNSYSTGAFSGGSGLYAFGGYPSDSSTGPKEDLMTDFVGYVNGAYKASGVVFACSMARMSLFTEAQFAFQSFTGTRPGDLVPGDGLELLQHPWPGGVTSSLLARAIQDVDMAGNAYFVRQGVMGDERLRRLRPDWVMILLDGDPQCEAYTDVIAYIYKPGNTPDSDKWEIFPVDGSNGLVAHWAPIPDPEATYRGMSWLTPVLREISMDKAITTHKLRYFQNGAKPGMVVSYDASVTPQQSAEFTEKFNQTKLGADNAYRPLFLGGGATVTTFSGNVEEFKDLSSASEVRIAAAARVPGIIVGLVEAMKGSALNPGNFEASKQLFADGTIRPLWASLCAVLEPLIDRPADTRLWYNDRDIAFLKTDAQVTAQRQSTDASTLASLVQSGFTPESAVLALIHNDWTLLDHCGLYSVQLLPPGDGFDQDFKGTSPVPNSGPPKSPPNIAGK